MPSANSFLVQELTKFVEAAWFDLPAETAKVLFGAGDEGELRKAAWKAYDAWVNLANELTNAFYSDPLIGEATGRMMEAALRFRHVSGLMASAVFGNFWPLIGLPTHGEMVALREDLLSLREELRAYAARLSSAELGGTQTGDDVSATSTAHQVNGRRSEQRNRGAARNEGSDAAAR